MDHTTTSPAHPPTPWRSFQVGPKYVIHSDAKDITLAVTSGWGARYAAEEAANAAFIVRACNSYADLLAACHAALEEDDDYKAMEQIKAAIDKAEGRG